MAIYHVPSWIKIPNGLSLADLGLSLQAKGLLGHCLGFDPDTRVTIRGEQGLAHVLRESHPTIRKAMGELIKHQYAEKTGTPTGGKGRRGVHLYFDIYEVPKPTYLALKEEYPYGPNLETWGSEKRLTTRVYNGSQRLTTRVYNGSPERLTTRVYNGFLDDKSLINQDVIDVTPERLTTRVYTSSSSCLKDLKDPDDERVQSLTVRLGEPCSNEQYPCRFDPFFPCLHVQAMRSLLGPVLGHNLSRDAVSENVFWSVHEFSLDEISLIYDFRMARGDDREVLHPNTTLSRKVVGRLLYQATVWADKRGEAERAERDKALAPCECKDMAIVGEQMVCPDCGRSEDRLAPDELKSVLGSLKASLSRGRQGAVD